jgi:hypothetical protein
MSEIDEDEREHVVVSGSLTKDEWERALTAERDYARGQVAVLAERLRGIDKATELLSATVNRVPTDLQKAVVDILRLMDERDLRVQHRFIANEKLAQTESNLNQTALTAALNAAKEAADVIKVSLESKIASQGATTDRTIDKNAELAAQESAALSARVTAWGEQMIALNNTVTGILASGQAVRDVKVDTRGGAQSIQGYVGMVVSIVAVIIAAVAVIIGTR